MDFISANQSDNILRINFVRHPVNAINHQFLLELNSVLDKHINSADSSVVVFSGNDLKFFSFGLDIPEYLTLNRSDLKDSLNLLVATCNKIYQYPKITISKINGHATGGGCMIALSTDFRYMVDGRSKIALNEINIGLSLFSSTIQILKSVVGSQNAKTILYSGKMFSPYEAKDLGLVDFMSLNNLSRRMAVSSNNLGEPSYGRRNIFLPSSEARPCPAKKMYTSLLLGLVVYIFDYS